LKIFRSVLLSVIIIVLGCSLSLPGFIVERRPLQAQGIPLDKNYFFPAFFNNPQIPYSTSYYLPTVDGAFLYGLGCEHGMRDLALSGAQDSVIVLDFSYPVYDSSFGYGAALFEDNPWDTPTVPVPISEIIQAVKRFAIGYYNCSGEDTASNLVIGVGTNNKPTSIETASRATAHGHAWGTMVSDLNQWALNQKILHQVQFYGASDIEISWNTPAWTRAWIAGFEQNEDVLMLHFGDAAGCPYDENPHWSCGSDWTVEDVWYVSWGAPSALPLPLIYLTNGVHAKQWAFLSRYSVENHGYRMDFTGVFTQWQYCQQFTWCNGTDNSPEAAYQQMLTELNKDPNTSQSIRWKSDIRWVRESEVSGANETTTEVAINASDHPIQQEIIKIEHALQQTGLSDTLKTSLETKINIYQNMANWIQTSKQSPASKD